MKTRHKLLLCALLVFCAVAAAMFWEWAPRPKWHGKDAAQWYAYYRKHVRSNPATNMVMFGRTFTAYIHPLPPPVSDPAADGLRALGTNSALFLGRELARPAKANGWIVRRYIQVYLKCPQMIQKISPQPWLSPTSADPELTQALESLTTNQWAAAPPMIDALKTLSKPDRDRILRVLGQIPFEPEAVTPVLKALDKRADYSAQLDIIHGLSLRTQTAVLILTNSLFTSSPGISAKACTELQWNRLPFETVMPALLIAAESEETERSVSALRVLQHYGLEAAPAFPTLFKVLSSRDAERRYAVVRTLETLGSLDGKCEPLLKQAAGDQSEMVRNAASRALEALEDEENKLQFRSFPFWP